MGFLFGPLGIAWSFLRNLTWREILAIVITAGGALLYILGHRAGAKGEREAQALADMEFGRDIQDAADKARRKHDTEMAGLPELERKRRALDRLRAKGRARD